MSSSTDTLSGMVTKKGRFGTDPYDILFKSGRMRLVNSACFVRMPSLMDVFSGMVTKKGRFGTDPYDIFFKHGTYAPRKLGVLCKDTVPYGCYFGHGYKEGSV